MKLGAYIGLFLWFVFSCLPICHSQPIENNRNQTSNQKAERDCLINVDWSEWKPYQYLGKNGRVAGYQINLLDLIGAKMGCQMVYRQQSDWQSSVESLETQHIDLIGNASLTKNRLKYFYFSCLANPLATRTLFRNSTQL